MTITLNERVTTALLNQAVADRGSDYVYPNDQKDDNNYNGVCRYVFRGDDGSLTEAGCIVGYVLAMTGVPLETLAPYDVAGDGQVTAGGDLLDELNHLGIISIDGPSYRLLVGAQSAQDSGNTWGVAIERAKEYE